MSAKVVFRGKPLKLDDTMLLGEGGEARVFAHPTLDLALKIFHAPAVAGPSAALDDRLRALRAQKLRVFPDALPRTVVGPQELIHDAAGALVGYAMRKISGAVDIAALARKATHASFDAASILRLFRTLRDTLDVLHTRSVHAGDLNDGNIVIAGVGATAEPYLIDADSMQLPSPAGVLPCAVAHERFLDPRLFGRSLVDAPLFDDGTDHYALRVLLFQSLVCLHPYGGVHPVLPTLLRRAEASWSVLRSDVQIPRAAIPWQTLHDDQLHDFERCFDHGARDPLAPGLLDVPFRRCTCGVEHARAACPVCKVAVQAPAIRTQGGVREETLLETRGLVLQARVLGGAGGRLAFLVDEDGRVRREDHGTVLAHGGTAHPHHLRFAIAGETTWIANGTDLVAVRGEQVVDSARTELVRGSPAFVAGSTGLFVLEGDALVHHESRARVGRVLLGQTALLGGDGGGLGLYRAGRMLMGVLFHATRFCDAELPQPRGKLIDLDVTFDAEAMLVGMAEDIAGQRVHTLALIDARGRLIATASGTPESEPCLQSIRGKCISGGRILSTSSEGVCAIDVDAGARRLHTGSVFVDTRPFVDATVELLPSSGGALVVVAPQAITRLRLSGSRT